MPASRVCPAHNCNSLNFISVRNEVAARLYFHRRLSVSLFTGGGGEECLVDTPSQADTPRQTPPGRHPPGRCSHRQTPLGRHPAGQTPPCPVHAGIHTPPVQCMLGYIHSPAQCKMGYNPPSPAASPAGGTHPTGMHSCCKIAHGLTVWCFPWIHDTGIASATLTMAQQK